MRGSPIDRGATRSHRREQGAGAALRRARRRWAALAAGGLLAALAMSVGPRQARADGRSSWQDPGFTAPPPLQDPLATPQLPLVWGGPRPSCSVCKRRLRAEVELLAVLAANAAWYWIPKATGSGSPNWELGWDNGSWRKKLGTFEALALDTNPFFINFASHPLSGSLHYLIARGNDLSMAESFVFATAGSVIWEFIGEFRERPSINDLIISPVAGMAVGETLARLSAFLGRGSPSSARDLLAGALWLPRTIQDRIDGRRRRRAVNLDEFGLPVDVWHRFHLDAVTGFAVGDGGRAQRQLGLRLDTELIDVPKYGRPGGFSRAISGGSATALSLEGAFDTSELSRLRFLARTSLGGWAWQDLQRPSAGRLEGYSLLLGADTEFQIESRNIPGAFVDRSGTVGLGPTADLTVYSNRLRLRAGVSASGDFGAVRAAAIDTYLDANGSRGIKTLLATDERVYFALGRSFGVNLEGEYGGILTAADLSLDWFDSIDGHDRLQSAVTKDFHLKDRRARGALRFACVWPGTRFEVPSVRIEHLERTGRIGHFRGHTAETRFSAGLGLRF